ncbi:MAG: YHYH protein [Saprospiraceae bacterium]|nr:YHYH protein [Saprospiraceae bacterium]
MKTLKFLVFGTLIFLLSQCTDTETDDGGTTTPECTSDKVVDKSRGACNETLTLVPSVKIEIVGANRVITANSIPNHKVGLFGNVAGSLNPNAIRAQNKTYTITNQPVKASQFFSLTNATTLSLWSFGVLLNGVELDPIAAEPWPHQGLMATNVNWEWNLEATNVKIGLDCNNAHVQPTGKYHYHGSPTLYLQNANIPSNKMTLVGYAADGFPVYYKYAYTNATDANSAVIAMTSSYRLKSGKRPGDGVIAPCGSFDGVYSNDYEFVSGLGTLDQANGREGVTPEYPTGTYYYLITDDFPNIPRYFRGTPAPEFKVN